MAPMTARPSRLRPISQAATAHVSGIAPGVWRESYEPDANRPATTVRAVTPNSGSTLGGTSVDVTGANFAAGAQVTFGGVAATVCQVVSSTRLPQRPHSTPPEPVDVAVSAGGRAGNLPARSPTSRPAKIPNEPPMIHVADSAGQPRDEPAQFADLGEEIPSRRRSPMQSRRRIAGLRVERRTSGRSAAPADR